MCIYEYGDKVKLLSVICAVIFTFWYKQIYDSLEKVCDYGCYSFEKMY